MIQPSTVTGAVNILTDMMILAIPMPLVWKLQVGGWRRASLVFAFSLGSFVVFAGICRFYTIFLHTDAYGDISCTAPITPQCPSEKSEGVRGVRGNEG